MPRLVFEELKRLLAHGTPAQRVQVVKLLLENLNG